MVTHTANEILLVETYNSATPGIFPTGLDAETNDLLIQIYCNPIATPAVQKGSLEYLLNVLHNTGSNGIWMEMELAPKSTMQRSFVVFGRLDSTICSFSNV